MQENQWNALKWKSNEIYYETFYKAVKQWCLLCKINACYWISCHWFFVNRIQPSSYPWYLFRFQAIKFCYKRLFDFLNTLIKSNDTDSTRSAYFDCTYFVIWKQKWIKVHRISFVLNVSSNYNKSLWVLMPTKYRLVNSC